MYSDIFSDTLSYPAHLLNCFGINMPCDIMSNSLSDILCGILFNIFSDNIFDILFGILCGNYLEFCLTFHLV